MEADLVLEGGGVKGIGLVGAISLLTEKGYRFHRVGGTSAGAVVGSLVAAGISTERLEEVIREVYYTRFQDASGLARVPFVGPFLSLALEDGIYEGNYLKRWLGAHLAELGVRTFGDLRLDDDPEASLPPERRYRLVVMTADVSQGRLVRLPWDYQHLYGAGNAKVPELVARLLELADELRKSGIDEAELTKVKRRFRYDLLSSIDDANAMAGWFGGTALLSADFARGANRAHGSGDRGGRCGARPSARSRPTTRRGRGRLPDPRRLAEVGSAVGAYR